MIKPKNDVDNEDFKCCVSKLKSELVDVVNQYDEIFQEPKGLPPKRGIQHEIQLQQDCPLPNIGMYRMSVMESAEIKKKVQDYLDKGIIRPSSAPCGSTIVFVPKKDGTWRMCVDFPALNKITIKNYYPLPIIDDLLDQLKDAKYFTKLDLRSGYHQITIAEGDIWKTTFKTKQGLFEWLVMPFGLCNAPATFMRVINDVLRPFIDDFVIVYLDEILIFSKSHDEHAMHVGKVLDVLKKEQLYLKMSKCEFGKTSLVYLGHIVGGGELKIDPSKVDVILNWRGPKIVTEQLHLVIKNKKGIYNKVVNVLSRPIVSATNLLKHNSILHESYIEQYSLDNDFQDVYAKLSQGNQVEELDYHLHDNSLYHLGKLCIPQRERVNTIREAHTSLIPGHFGVISKPSNRKIGLYTPLMVPSRPWESVSLDFVGGIQLSKRGHDYLYVVVDTFNKMCILMPCKKQVTIEHTA
eukprot:PITA_25300